MNESNIKEILKNGTNMTDHDIEKHIKDGISVYENTEKGYNDFKIESINCLCDPEDIPEMWQKLNTIESNEKSYKINFIL